MKRLKIDFNQCCGCRRCEVACSLHHFENSVNPKKSRIRIYEEEDVFYPVVAGPFNNAELPGFFSQIRGCEAPYALFPRCHGHRAKHTPG